MVRNELWQLQHGAPPAERPCCCNCCNWLGDWLYKRWLCGWRSPEAALTATEKSADAQQMLEQTREGADILPTGAPRTSHLTSRTILPAICDRLVSASQLARQFSGMPLPAGHALIVFNYERHAKQMMQDHRRGRKGLNYVVPWPWGARRRSTVTASRRPGHDEAACNCCCRCLCKVESNC